ncbi:hypothetical protein NL676_024761 [Syzygium grande]|nr:hypothetical protein NL676_024761 [Syzygium grande]
MLSLHSPLSCLTDDSPSSMPQATFPHAPPPLSSLRHATFRHARNPRALLVTLRSLTPTLALASLPR